MHPAAWRVRAAEAREEAAFDSSGRGEVEERTWSTWAPSVGDPGLERIALVALDQGGAPRALVTGALERVAVGAVEERWLRVERLANACAAPASLARGGAVDAVLAALAERMGPEPPAFPVAYALPSRRALRLARRLSETEPVRAQLRLVLAPCDFESGEAPGVAVEDVARAPEGLDALFAAAREAHGALRVRDAAAVQRRFLDAPPAGQRVSVARRGGELLGFAVHRPGAFAGSSGLALVDWLEHPAAPEAGHALRARLVERARDEGHALVLALFNESAPCWRAFQDASFRVRATRDFLVARSPRRAWSAALLRAGWYTTASDFEAAGGAA